MRWRRALIGTVVAVEVTLGGLWLFQWQFIYLPQSGVPSVGDVLPGWEEVVVQSADGATLGTWYRAPDPAHRS